jgi:hypothetical protein
VVEAGTQVNYNHRLGRGVRRLGEILSGEADAGATRLIDSANGTWLDRIESAAQRIRGPRRGVVASSLRGSLAECFSAGPLAAVAAALAPGPTGDPGGGRYTVLGSDFNGLTAAIRVRRPSD